jgi:hypothetical protein
MARSTRSGSLARELPRAAGVPGRVSAVKPAESGRIGLATRRTATMAKTEAAKSLQRFVRQEYWNGLSAGEVVRGGGPPARGRAGCFVWPPPRRGGGIGASGRM